MSMTGHQAEPCRVKNRMIVAVKILPLANQRPNTPWNIVAAICLAPPAMTLWGTSTAHSAAVNQAHVLLCADDKDTVTDNYDMRQAVTAAFGKELRFQAADSSRGCTELAGLLKFADAKVLMTATTDAGESSPSQSAHLSAYFFRGSSDRLQLVASKENFGESNGSWGNVGEISAAHFGPDDGMMATGESSQQGYSNESADFYAFRNGGIVSLGMVPTGWSNDGAAASENEAVTVTGKVETDLQRPDSVRVVYTRSAHGEDDRTSVAIWHSQAGKFVLEAGSVPKEVVENFDLDADALARNGTAIDPADAAPSTATGKERQDLFSINDAGMEQPASEIIEAIKKAPNYPHICKLTGKKMLPSLSEGMATWFVTTSNRCDAGGGLGPAWIVSVAPSGKASVVLSEFLRAVKIQDSKHGDFRDIVVNGDAKHPDSGDIYSFDGTTYRKTKS